MTTVIYEGKAKTLYSNLSKKELIVEYKDTITAFNNQKRDQFTDKGKINACISEVLFKYLEENGVETHFINSINPGRHKIKPLEMIHLEVVVRNIATGSIIKNLPIRKGFVIKPAIVEYYYKSDTHQDPLINDDHINLLKVIKRDADLQIIRELAITINSLLQNFFAARELTLVDLKLEFGYDELENIILADEISPDTFRLWDTITGDSLDKDLFRDNTGDILAAYSEVLNRCRDSKTVNIEKSKFLAEVSVELKPDILDPQGKAIQESLHNLGFSDINDLRVGKCIKMTIESSSISEANQLLNKASVELLANPVIESYKTSIREV